MLTHLMHLLLVLEHRGLMGRVEVSLRMGTGTSRYSWWHAPWHHASHHRASLTDLWASRIPDMLCHLLVHRYSRLWSSWHALIRNLALHHGVTVYCHATWMLCERLSHACHHGRFVQSVKLSPLAQRAIFWTSSKSPRSTFYGQATL